MKCGLLVLHKEKRRKGRGTLYRVATNHLSWWQIEMNDINVEERLAQGYEVCDGDLKVEVSAVEEPTWGGTIAEMKIVYSCCKCGGDFYPHLPQDASQLSAFVTDAVKVMDADALMEAHRQRMKMQFAGSE